MTTTTYTIDNCNGRTGRAWDATYASEDEAVEALRVAMGWTEIVLSDDYAITLPDDEDGRQRHGSAWSAYPTQEECDADRDGGAQAPRVVEVRS